MTPSGTNCPVDKTYRRLLKPILFLLSPETAHACVHFFLQVIQWIPGGVEYLRKRMVKNEPALQTQVWDLKLPSPLGLAAGFDKDADMFEALGALGFGFVEVGTLTRYAQPGNPQPRLFRLPADRALVNRMGFNNCGTTGALERLKKPRSVVVGVNIGKSKVTPLAEATKDYVDSARRVADLADYVVVNVSSPNTPGLRELQEGEKLQEILREVRKALDTHCTRRRVPLLVKIAPDLSDEQLDEIADLALRMQLDGIIATNTTTSREGLSSDPKLVAALGAGGLSGAPLAARALAVLQRLRERVGHKMVLISVGGIENAEQAAERLRAGATLVQIYTALIYGGPSLPRLMNRDLAALLAPSAPCAETPVR